MDKKLPTNYLITSLLDRKTNDDKQKEIHCDPCKFAKFDAESKIS